MNPDYRTPAEQHEINLTRMENLILHEINLTRMENLILLERERARLEAAALTPPTGQLITDDIDMIKASALGAARIVVVDLTGIHTVDDIIDAARQFEAYLREVTA